MATVHPSRMGLVPQENDVRRYRSRSRTPERSRYRSKSRGRERERERDSGYGRRYSPEYKEYSKESNNTAAPWHSQDNMYPERKGGRRDNYYQSGSGDYFTHRQQLRDSKQFSIWPPSPKSPIRNGSRSRSRSPRRKRQKRSRRERSVTPSSETDSSEEERRRRERKARKRREKEERREPERRRRRERERTRSKSVEDFDKKRRSRTKTRSPSPESDSKEEDEEWVEKPSANALVSSAGPFTTFSNHNPRKGAGDDSENEFGPQPAPKTSTKVDERAYGGSLLRGEGSAMAAFLADDTNARIPRRGEIGLASDQIASFEAAGYVMSGSRHRRMNAVRLRKENQVISAEEKRGILKLQKEERSRREELLREEFKELMQEKLKAAGTKPPETQ